MASLVRDWGGFALSGGALTTPFGASAGSTLMLAMAQDYFDAITDSRGNTYIVDSAGGANDGANFVGLGHGYITTPLLPGDTITLTLHFGGGTNCLTVAEFSGLASGNSADVITNQSNGASTSIAGAATGPLAFSQDLAIVAICHSASFGSITDVSPPGVVPMTGVVLGGGHYLDWRYAALSSNASITYSGTGSTPSSNGVIVGTYQTVAAPPTAQQVPGPAPLLGRFGR